MRWWSIKPMQSLCRPLSRSQPEHGSKGGMGGTIGTMTDLLRRRHNTLRAPAARGRFHPLHRRRQLW